MNNTTTPIIPVRAMHLDLKGVPPTPERLLQLPALAAGLGFNAMLVEWEDMFPWTVDERFRNETAYTADTVRAFADEAARQGVELIPLVQCLGHLETVLSTPGYESMREVPDRRDALNPLADGAADLIRRLIDDVLTLLPNVQRLHLGGDEVWQFGKHPDTAAFVADHGKGALYLRHVEPLMQHLASRDIRPLLWHDMMRDWDSDSLHKLAQRADLVVWGYGYHPDETRGHYHTSNIERFAQHGMRLWGAAAYKGADGPDADLPDPQMRRRNVEGWLDVARRFEMRGVIATAWSRYNTLRVQCEPIDGALDMLALTGALLRDGRAPDDIEPVLDNLGEGDRWRQCYAALHAFSEARHGAWHLLRQFYHQLGVSTVEPERHDAAMISLWLDRAHENAEQMRACVDTLRGALTGLIPEPWIERYWRVRTEALARGLADAEARRDAAPAYH